MNVLFLSLFSGINMAFAILTTFIWFKNKDQRLYIYFAIFSLFSGLYFILKALSITFNLDIFGIIIFCAGVYYAVFPWFVFELIKKKNNTLLFILTLIFAFAIAGFVLDPWDEWISIGQIIAHIGLIGLMAVTIYASIILVQREKDKAIDFILLTIVFVFLGLEEIISLYSGHDFLNKYINSTYLLDIYPLLFTLIIGKKLTYEVYNRNKIKIELIKGELKEKQLQLAELEKIRLNEELQFKSMDLTNFGIEITKNRAFIQSLQTKLIKIKSLTKSDSIDFNEVLKSLKSRLIINKDLNYFNGNVEKINHAFNTKLKESYPSLTSNEVHLASLLRLNLNTKEIAIIKNVSPDSVKVLRYRLRKKMDMKTSINLSEFLNNIN
ncbi:MAG: hypothetical protein L3J34_03465 [Flavobacteriaceae bacterium]|nr:hypothetical protein [Flavobacteriaceae bacterium]